jgi:hypothetical protein
MGWSQSFIPASTLRDALSGVITLNLGASYTGLKCALFSNAFTPDPDADPQAYGAGQWASNEVTGTSWPAGGVPVSLTGKGISRQAGNYLMLQAVDLSVSGAVISTAAYGALIYDHSNSGQPNVVVAALYFGGDGITNPGPGALGIQWATSSGIFNVPLATS